MMSLVSNTSTRTAPMTTTERKRLRSPHQPVGRWIRADKRLAIYLRDGFRCLCCGRDLHGADPRDVTLDHIVPVSKGGSNMESNVYTCCRSCNSSRAAKTLRAFIGAPGVANVRRYVRRALKRYLVLARGLMAGTCGDAVEQARAE